MKTAKDSAPVDRHPWTALVDRWEAEPNRPGRPTCPCGFRGGNRNIRQHRSRCPVWGHLCLTTRLKNLRDLGTIGPDG